MELPRVLILSLQKGKAATLAKKIGGELVGEANKVQYYNWNIDNRYYTAQVLLCATDSLPLALSSDAVEAVVLYYDPKQPEDSLKNYEAVIKLLTDADVMLLACEGFPDANKRDEATEWCHTHKFELVDMERLQDLFENMEDDMVEETYGIERIVEALQTHPWLNRSLKGLNNGRISTSNELDVSQMHAQLENIHLENSDSSNHLLTESVLDGIMGSENADFGELFSQLTAMKEHAASLSTSNRKAAAEQLVTAFWRAMGGDSSELDDVDD